MPRPSKYPQSGIYWGSRWVLGNCFQSCVGGRSKQEHMPKHDNPDGFGLAARRECAQAP